MSSHKDSSVARSRLKRPHRIPARFEDFSTLPTTHHISSPDLERSVSPPPELKPQHTSKSSTIEKVVKEKSIPTSSNLNTTTNPPNTGASKTSPPPPPPLQAKEQIPQVKNKTPDESHEEELHDSNNSINKSDNHSRQIEGASEQQDSKKNNKNTNRNLLQNNNDNATKSNPRKKSRGFSLMVKKNPNSVLFQPNNSNVNNSPINIMTNYGNGDINRVNPQQLLIQQQQQQQQQQTAKYYTSNLSQCMQYGTRLMINEPIYLPRNVATIAPITTTLQQMEEQVRKLPLLSEKAKQCIAYQEQRKMNCLASNFDALVRITSHLEVCDLLNLRLVNKTWKSVIDSDVVWQKVKIAKTIIKNCDGLGKILAKHQTTDLYLKDLELKVSWYRVFENLIRDDVNLKRIFITSSSDSLNRHIVELLCVLNCRRSSGLKVHWRVKSHVDDAGFILIPFKTRRQLTLLPDPNMNLYCYTVHSDWLTDEKNSLLLLELTDINDLFNNNRDDKSDVPALHKPEIIIEPI